MPTPDSRPEHGIPFIPAPPPGRPQQSRDQMKRFPTAYLSLTAAPSSEPRAFMVVAQKQTRLLAAPYRALRSWLGSNSFNCNVLRSRDRQGAGCKSQYFTPSKGAGASCIFHAFSGSVCRTANRPSKRHLQQPRRLLSRPHQQAAMGRFAHRSPQMGNRSLRSRPCPPHQRPNPSEQPQTNDH
jgi:hypothetical protein